MTVENTRLARRVLMQLVFAIAVVGLARSAWAQTPRAAQQTESDVPSLAPPGSLIAVGFLHPQGRPGLTHEEYIKWYEGTHAPEFVGIVGPHLARYTRNYVVEVEEGGTPAFQVITEIVHKSEAEKKEVVRLYSKRMQPPPAQANAPSRRPDAVDDVNRLISVEERLISGLPYSSDPIPATRRIVVLKRPAAVSEQEFSSAVNVFVWDLAKAIAGPKVRVVLSLKRPWTEPGLADGFVAIDHFSGGRLPVPKLSAVQILHVLQVESHSSNVG